MAGAAFLAKGFLVFVVLFVAGITILWGFLEHRAFVTFLAFNF